MNRREFMTLVGGAAAALPLAARAQQPGAMRRIGIFMGQLESDPQGQARVAAFRQGLRELKWVEGNNISIDIRWGSGDAAQVSAFAAELVNLAPEVILGSNTPQMRALKKATQTIPIVFAGLADPVGADTSLHPDEARRQVGKPHLNLTTRPFLAQDDRATAIVADDVERVLADIDADHGGGDVWVLGHGVLLVWQPHASVLR